jgi:hypothetical protein
LRGALQKQEGSARREHKQIRIRRIVPKSQDQTPSTYVTSHWTFEDWEFQSDIHRRRDDKNLLVNQEKHKSDVGLWLALLRHHERRSGTHGIMSIWQGIKERRISLPAQGSNVSELWEVVIGAAVVEERLHEVLEYARELNQQGARTHETVYTTIMRTLFASDPTSAWPWHLRLKELGLPTQGCLTRLVEPAMSSNIALQVFERVYRDAGNSKIYDVMMTTLCSRNRYLEAIYWHDVLTSAGDHPSSITVTEPLRRHFKVDLKEKTKAGSSSPEYHAHLVPSFTTTSTRLSRYFMNKVLGERHGIAQKYISDRTCAKALATGAFSVDFVIRSLSAFGVEAIGPLAFRELGLRAGNSIDMMKHVKTLHQLDMRVENRIFSQLVLKLAADEEDELLQALLASDQHPDVFEDKSTQTKLLSQHIQDQDWVSMRIAILALTHGHRWTPRHGYNVLLRARIDTGDMAQVYALVEEMIASDVEITTKSLKHAFFQWVPYRRPGQGLVHDREKTEGLLDFIAFLVRLLKQGVPVAHTVWSQPLIYLGIDGKLADLEALAIWLALVYSKAWASLSAGARLHKQRELFPTNLQKAIVAWGFASSVKPVAQATLLQHLGAPELLSASDIAIRKYSRDAVVRRVGSPSGNVFASVIHGEPFVNREMSWMRGVSLLKILKECGVKVETLVVQKACKQRLIQLFGRRISKRRVNRLARRQNKRHPMRMLRDLNIIWQGRGGTPLFPRVKNELRRAIAGSMPSTQSIEKLSPTRKVRT